ncbi:MAG: hypothetical protein CMD33_08970 [Flavobacteriales bacterium]|nr:hypothetical protein [Flavobacteriales bacterium]
MSLYSQLGLSHDASDSDIRKAYRKKALVNHPDRGGSTEKFREIQSAYDVLSDAPKKRMYDISMQRIFRPPVGPTVKRNVDVTLERLYVGTVLKFNIVRRRIIVPDANNNVKRSPCNACDGRGSSVQTIRMAGRIIQHTTICSACRRSGITLAPDARIEKKTKTITVKVPPGTRGGTEFTFQGESDEDAHHAPGDVVIIIRQSKHDKFGRSGSTLTLHHEISLWDALTSPEIRFVHLNNTEVVHQVEPGTILSPDTVIVLENMGMPTSSEKHTFGRMEIRFDVKYPKTIDPAFQTSLKKIIGDNTQAS